MKAQRSELLRKIKSYSRISGRFAELGIPEVEIPNLLAMQVDSFHDFLQKDIHPQRRAKKGLQAVFEAIFPIEDNKGNFLLEFIEYNVLQEKYAIDECRERNLSYQAPLKAKMRLSVSRPPRQAVNIKIPWNRMYFWVNSSRNRSGTFIINGAERVIISAQRSRRLFWVKHPSGSSVFCSNTLQWLWLEFDIDIHDVMFVHMIA